jgi:hypothetical protein
MTNSKFELLKDKIQDHLLRIHRKYNFGYFYIAFNKSMPGWIKIGITKKKVKYRMASLSQSTPTDFIVLYSEKIPMFTAFEAYIKNSVHPTTKTIKGKKYKCIYPHGREWIYYGNDPKISLGLKNRPWNTWNSRGELVEKIKNIIKYYMIDNFAEEMNLWDKDYVVMEALSSKDAIAYYEYIKKNGGLV